MSAARLSLEGLPDDISRALTAFSLAQFACGRVVQSAGDGSAAHFAQLSNASRAREVLVTAIRVALATPASAVLPYEGTIELGADAPIETSEADATPLRWGIADLERACCPPPHVRELEALARQHDRNHGLEQLP